MRRGGGSPKRKTASKSAGYHSDLSIPGYQPKTPTKAPPKKYAAKSPAGNYSGADEEYAAAVAALPPAARAVTEAAAGPVARAATRRVRVQRRQRRIRAILNTDLSKPQKRSQAVRQLKRMDRPVPGPKASRSTSHIESNPAKAVISSHPNPKAKPPVFQGKKTAAAPTRKELQAAAKAGTLKVNKAGYATTPKVRKVGGELRQLRAQSRSSSAPLPGLGPEETKVARAVLRTGKKMGATRKELLAAAETGLVESGFKNYTDQAETDADSLGWRQERTSIYGSDATKPKQGARNFFSETKEQSGATAGELAANVQRPAEQYRGRYDEVKPEAAAILRAFNKGGLKPAQQKRLRQLTQEAERLGMKVGRPAPDVAAAGKYVKVRADAKGMVSWVKANLGTDEGTPKTMRWGAKYGLEPVSQPWCANFVSNGLARRGVPVPPNPNYVPSFESEWSGGRNIGSDLSKAKPGDLITYSGQHIAVYIGGGKAIGGNQSDSVTEGDAVSLSSAPISMILRPNYKGGFVKVKETASLPGSVAVTGSLSSSSAPAAASLVAGPSIGSRGRAGESRKPKLTARQKVNRANRKLRALSLPKGAATSEGVSVVDELAEKYGVAVV